MAKLFEWISEYDVGIVEIDEQHLMLVELLNELDEAIRNHRGSKAVRGILGELLEYTRNHFSLEERLMLETGYPAYAEHCEYHAKFVNQVAELQNKVDKGEGAITFELLHFLRVWLVRHICGVDKEFANWYFDHGSKPNWMDKAHAEMKKKRWWQFWK